MKMLLRSPVALLFLALSFLCLRAAATTNSPTLVPGFAEQKVIPDDGAGDDGFGYAVAISGTTAMVAEAKATVNGNEAQGEVYVFTKSGRRWVLTQKLVASDGAADDLFGSSIALSGDTAIIGAIGFQTDQGAVYVYNRSGGIWTQTQKIIASDGTPVDDFGYSVALSGTRLLVGAKAALDDRGAAYFYDYDQSSGGWVLRLEVTPSDVQPEDYFGADVALTGTTALIGAFDINGHTAGAAYIFNYSPDFKGGWMQTQKLVPIDGQPGDWFGFSVALSDTTAVIGASQARINNNLQQGAVYVFSNSGGQWMERQKLLANDGGQFGDLGWNVALDGNMILAGAIGRQAAYLFAESGGAWSQEAELIPGDNPPSGGSFGWKVALDGNTSLVSAPFSIVNGNPEGAAYFYRHTRGFRVKADIPELGGSQ